MDLQCTAVFRRVPEGYIAIAEEFPGANTQGASLEEARTNLREAVALRVTAARSAAALRPGSAPRMWPVRRCCVISRVSWCVRVSR